MFLKTEIGGVIGYLSKNIYTVWMFLFFWKVVHEREWSEKESKLKQVETQKVKKKKTIS